MIFLFQKGQEEAPFQLLVAVILMTFVIIVGLSAMQQAEKQKCFNDTEKLMNDLKLAIEKTATYSQPSNIKFSPPDCTKDKKFVLIASDEERICKKTCLNSSSSCILLRYSTSEITGIQDKCLNISFDTQFRYEGDGTNTCESLEGYSGLKLDSSLGIPQGTFQFFYYPNPVGTSPVVCSYIKE